MTLTLYPTAFAMGHILPPVGWRAPRNHENDPSPQLPSPSSLSPGRGKRGRGERVRGVATSTRPCARGRGGRHEGLEVVQRAWVRGLAHGEALRFMSKQVGESQNYVLRQPAPGGGVARAACPDLSGSRPHYRG
jgi:hypothetical protein